MKLPWVSREAYDVLRYNKDAAAANAEHFQQYMADQYAALLSTHEALLEKYHSLKLQGAVAPDPIVPRTAKEADPIIQQINTLAAGRPGLRAQMIRQLNTDRTIGMLDDAEIMQRIEMGVVIDEGLPA